MLIRPSTLSWIFLFLLLSGCTKPAVTNPVAPINPVPPVNNLPVDSASVIYLSAGYSNDLFAIDPANGNILWSAKVSGTANTSAAYSEGTIMVKGYDNGQSEDISAFGIDGKPKWSFHLPGNFEAPEQIALMATGGVVYTQDLEHIYAINVSDGSVKWTFEKTDPSGMGSGTCILKNHVLYAMSYHSYLYALDELTGNLQWVEDMGSQLCTPFISEDSFFVADGQEILIYNSHTGQLKKNIPGFPTGGPINIQYGRIFSFDGKSTDTATFTQAYPFFSFEPRFIPSGSSYPIVADSMVILPYGIYNAFTGNFICKPPSMFDAGSSGGYLCGATYLNHILYYTTGERSAYDGGGAEHHYSDVYAYDVRSQTLLWQKTIQSTNIFDVEPCIVTKSGMVYRGIYSFK